MNSLISGDPSCHVGADTAPSALGLLARGDFDEAKRSIVDFGNFADHEDWLEMREGVRMGYSMAGLDLPLVPVSLASSLRCSRMTGVAPEIRSFDAFAALTAQMRASPRTRVLAALHKTHFDRHRDGVEALAAFANFADWKQHRLRVRANAAALQTAVAELDISLSEFVAWCRCVAATKSEPILDRYAQLSLEELTSAGRVTTLQS